MSVIQVEEYYIYIENKEIDFDKARPIAEGEGYEFNQDDDFVTIEPFYDECAANQFEKELKRLAPAKE